MPVDRCAQQLHCQTETCWTGAHVPNLVDDGLPRVHPLGKGFLSPINVLPQPVSTTPKPGDWMRPAAQASSAVNTAAGPTNVMSCSSTSTWATSLREAELLHSQAQCPNLPHFRQRVCFFRSSISPLSLWFSRIAGPDLFWQSRFDAPSSSLQGPQQSS